MNDAANTIVIREISFSQIPTRVVMIDPAVSTICIG